MHISHTPVFEVNLLWEDWNLGLRVLQLLKHFPVRNSECWHTLQDWMLKWAATLKVYIGAKGWMFTLAPGLSVHMGARTECSHWRLTVRNGARTVYTRAPELSVHMSVRTEYSHEHQNCVFTWAPWLNVHIGDRTVSSKSNGRQQCHVK